MRALKFAAWLLAAVLIHSLGVKFFDGFPKYVDLFLAVAVFNALDGNLVAAMLGGTAAGLLTDTFTGGLYGLFGFADTIVGYGAAFAARHLVIRRATGVWLVFCLAAAVQQVVTIGLSQLLLQEPSLPGFASAAGRVAITGLVGVGAFLAQRRIKRAVGLWKKSRTARLR